MAGVLSGEEALAHVRSSPPDLIVLDVLLPGLDGLEVCKALRRNPTTAGIPIVMLTARSEDADVVAGLELGADDYLTKPLARVSCWHASKLCCVASSLRQSQRLRSSMTMS